MPQRRQAKAPDAKAKPQEKPTRRGTTYPSAPKDPQERIEWVRRRNAHIQGVGEDEYLQAIADQQERRSNYQEPTPKGRQDR